MSESDLADLRLPYGKRSMTMMFKNLPLSLTPQQVAFVGSLLLSLIAYLGVVTIGKDGAFYVDIARTIVDQGVAAGAARFNWLGFPLLLAGLHQISGLPIEGLAYSVCALFMAGSCLLLVDLVARHRPQAAWWAVLVVLAVPAFNAFRGDIIREHGFWFFSVLAFWLAALWHARGGLLLAAGVHGAVVIAVIFRLEAMVLEVALALWLLPNVLSRGGWQQLLQFFWLPLVAVFALLLLLGVSDILSQGRVQYFIKMLAPLQIQQDFQVLSQGFADSLKYDFARDDAGKIVLMGVIGLILLNFVKLLGPFVLPLLTQSGREECAESLRFFRPLAYAGLLYCIVLLLFFFHQQFLNSRYTSFLHLLAVPLLAVATCGFANHYPKWAKALAVVAMLVMLDNVLSLGAKKTHYIEAGRWLSEHYQKTEAVFYDDPRIGYYAGWGYPRGQRLTVLDLQPEQIKQYQIFIVEADSDEAWLNDWMALNGLRQAARFANSKGDSVHVIVHGQQ